MNLIYTPLIGFPLCLFCVTFGLMLCCTIILIPLGLTLMALGFKLLTLQR